MEDWTIITPISESVGEGQNVAAYHQKINDDLIRSRYEHLLNDQPSIVFVEPQNKLTALVGGVFMGALGLYSLQEYVEDSVLMIGATFLAPFLFFTAFFLWYASVADKRNVVSARLANIETLSNWVKPIYVLPFDADDKSVEYRAGVIKDVLNDPKCSNELHKKMRDMEHVKFDYKINYGFKAGESVRTSDGLPVVPLYPELFILRGAIDEVYFLEFQKEVTRIAQDIDNQFAKEFERSNGDAYRILVASQEMI